MSFHNSSFCALSPKHDSDSYQWKGPVETTPSSKYLSNPSTKTGLTHIDSRTGKPSMVSVTDKDVTVRSATAVGKIWISQSAFDLVSQHPVNSNPTSKLNKKGDVLTVAQLAGIMGVKQTSNLIPLCHPLPLSHISVSLSLEPSDRSIQVKCIAECESKTGVEMEALTGASVSLLTVWDMVKGVGKETGDWREMRIGDIKVVRKVGGRSGDWEVVEQNND